MCCQRCYVRYVLRTAVSTPAAQRELRIPLCTELEREKWCMKNFRARILWTARENCWILILIPQRSLNSRTGSKATPTRAKVESPFGEVSSSNGVPIRPDQRTTLIQRGRRAWACWNRRRVGRGRTNGGYEAIEYRENHVCLLFSFSHVSCTLRWKSRA